MEVAIHQLKAGLSRYLQQARDGEDLIVTSHDKPVARIVGVPAQASDGLQALLAVGAARWSGRKPALLPPLLVPELPAGVKSLADSVNEDRG